MSTAAVSRPARDEYGPFYATYVDRVPDGDIVRLLADQTERTAALLGALPEERGDFRYAPAKWTIKQVIGHLCDAERIFAYRALRIARADTTPLAGFDENDYMRAARFDQRPLADVLGEFCDVRRATLSLLGSFEEAAFARRGEANGVPVTVRALAYIIAGHERHHLEVLKTRYGVTGRARGGPTPAERPPTRRARPAARRLRPAPGSPAAAGRE